MLVKKEETIESNPVREAADAVITKEATKLINRIGNQYPF